MTIRQVEGFKRHLTVCTFQNDETREQFYGVIVSGLLSLRVAVNGGFRDINSPDWEVIAIRPNN